MALITLQHSSINNGNKVSIPCSTATIGYNKSNINNPNENYDGDSPIVRVQSKSISNPIYTLQRIHLDRGTYGGLTALSQELLKQFLTLANDDSDPIYLNIKYDSSTQWSSLNKYTGSRVNDIPVTINGGITVTLSPEDSEDAYIPITSITLLEVKKV